jgi:hypothetical protein
MNFESKRDYYAGALIALIGAVAAYQGSSYGLGTLSQMEPGFFPAAIGIGMILVGAAIAATGNKGAAEGMALPDDPLHHTPTKVDWRSWIAIVGSVGLFMALAEYVGLLPAIFACVFVAALGSRTTSPIQALVLAICVTIFSIALFSYGLKIPIPVLRGI